MTVPITTGITIHAMTWAISTITKDTSDEMIILS